MGFIIAAAVAAAIIAFCFLCYKKAPPTQAIVVTGFGLSRPKVVCGRGVFVLPIVQRADRLNMRLLKIDVKTPETGVKTKEGVSLWLDSVVTVQVYSENSTVSDEEVRNAGYDDIRKYINSRQQAAISNFLGMDEAHINEKINDVLQGNLREIVSEMTVDQILTNRKQMAVSVVENARPDLANPFAAYLPQKPFLFSYFFKKFSRNTPFSPLPYHKLSMKKDPQIHCESFSVAIIASVIPAARDCAAAAPRFDSGSF